MLSFHSGQQPLGFSLEYTDGCCVHPFSCCSSSYLLLHVFKSRDRRQVTWGETNLNIKHGKDNDTQEERSCSCIILSKYSFPAFSVLNNFLHKCLCVGVSTCSGQHSVSLKQAEEKNCQHSKCPQSSHHWKYRKGEILEWGIFLYWWMFLYCTSASDIC